jgi:hypothetical protein
VTGAIRRVHLLVEGQTEEVVADAVIRPHLEGLGWATSLDVLTTLFDYYAFPVDCPGMGDQPSGDVYERVVHVERCLADAVGDRRFRPNLDLGIARLRAQCPHLDAWLHTFEE